MVGRGARVVWAGCADVAAVGAVVTRDAVADRDCPYGDGWVWGARDGVGRIAGRGTRRGSRVGRAGVVAGNRTISGAGTTTAGGGTMDVSGAGFGAGGTTGETGGGGGTGDGLGSNVTGVAGDGVATVGHWTGPMDTEAGARAAALVCGAGGGALASGPAGTATAAGFTMSSRPAPAPTSTTTSPASTARVARGAVLPRPEAAGGTAAAGCTAAGAASAGPAVPGETDSSAIVGAAIVLRRLKALSAGDGAAAGGATSE